MGRYIDPNVPLTDEDREFLAARSRHGEIVANDRQFGDMDDGARANATSTAQADADRDASDQAEWEQAEEDDETEFDDDLIAKVGPLKVAELRAALKKRGQESGGDKEELQERLLNFLQDERDKA